MDLWIVAAATGAGYLAKYWNRCSKNCDSSSQLSLPSEDSKFDNPESRSHPFREQPWRDKLGKDVSSGANLLNGLLEGEGARFGTCSKSNVLSISNLSLPISQNESFNDVEDGNEQSSYTNYGFLFPDSSSGEVGSVHRSAGNKTSLRTKHVYGHFNRPLNSWESCLMAQLCKEHAKMEEYIFRSLASPSIATRSFLVSDGSRIISRKSTDSSSELIQGEEYTKDIQIHVKNGNVSGIPSLQKIGSSENPKKMKLKAVKRQSGRLSSFNNAFCGKHFHSQQDAMFLFSLGISFGIITSMMANRREVDNLRGLLKQTENLVQDLQEELEMKDSMTVKELNNEKHGSQDMCDHSFYEKDLIRYSPGKHMNNSLRNDIKELYDQREVESSGSMSKIEAELEAELERLGLNMNTSSLDRIVSELDPEFEADFAQGELRTDMASQEASGHPKSDEDDSDVSESLPGIYAVSPRELSRRLHEVKRSRLEERVKELEIALENSQRKIQTMESKLGQASPFTKESLLTYDDSDHPLVLNLSGEALDAYNEAYEELIRRNDSEDNSPLGIHDIDHKEGSHSYGWHVLGIQHGGPSSSVTYSPVYGQKTSRELSSSKVTMLEGQSSGVSELNVVTGDENGGFDYEKERELIRKIVERTKKGSPVLQNAQRILYSTDEDEFDIDTDLCF